MVSDEEMLDRLGKLTWDTKLSPKDLLAILRSNDPSQPYQKQLYIKILNWFPWHQIREMIPSERLPELLSDDVIQGVFPRDMRDKYKYVKSLL